MTPATVVLVALPTVSDDEPWICTVVPETVLSELIVTAPGTFTPVIVSVCVPVRLTDSG
jgi:hypothetical protein